MRAVIQLVDGASVSVGGRVIGQIGRGLLILLGVHREDGEREAALLADKLARLRIFPDEEGRMNRSLLDVGGGALVISNFTLYADSRHGRRPSYTEAAPPAQAEPLYRQFARLLAEAGVAPVKTGEFGADMRVQLCNDGPVTLVLDTAELAAKG